MVLRGGERDLDILGRERRDVRYLFLYCGGKEQKCKAVYYSVYTWIFLWTHQSVRILIYIVEFRIVGEVHAIGSDRSAQRRYFV